MPQRLADGQAAAVEFVTLGDELGGQVPAGAVVAVQQREVVLATLRRGRGAGAGGRGMGRRRAGSTRA